MTCVYPSLFPVYIPTLCSCISHNLDHITLMIIILLPGHSFKGYIKVFGVTTAAIVVTFVQNFAQ